MAVSMSSLFTVWNQLGFPYKVFAVAIGGSFYIFGILNSLVVISCLTFAVVALSKSMSSFADLERPFEDKKKIRKVKSSKKKTKKMKSKKKNATNIKESKNKKKEVEKVENSCTAWSEESSENESEDDLSLLTKSKDQGFVDKRRPRRIPKEKKSYEGWRLRMKPMGKKQASSVGVGKISKKKKMEQKYKAEIARLNILGFNQESRQDLSAINAQFKIVEEKNLASELEIKKRELAKKEEELKLLKKRKADAKKLATIRELDRKRVSKKNK